MSSKISIRAHRIEAVLQTHLDIKSLWLKGNPVSPSCMNQEIWLDSGLCKCFLASEKQMYALVLWSSGCRMLNILRSQPLPLSPLSRSFIFSSSWPGTSPFSALLKFLYFYYWKLLSHFCWNKESLKRKRLLLESAQEIQSSPMLFRKIWYCSSWSSGEKKKLNWNILIEIHSAKISSFRAPLVESKPHSWTLTTDECDDRWSFFFSFF